MNTKNVVIFHKNTIEVNDYTSTRWCVGATITFNMDFEIPKISNMVFNIFLWYQIVCWVCVFFFVKV